MISKRWYLLISLIMALVGIVFCAYQKKIIIINPHFSQPFPISAQAYKKLISFFYWHENRWEVEQIPLLLSANIADTIHALVNQWLLVAHTEKIIKKKTSSLAVLTGYDNQTIFISLDRAPWNKENSTYEKWMNIEGILKTIRSEAVDFSKVSFLLDHQPLSDPHLDFTNPWPITGFLETS